MPKRGNGRFQYPNKYGTQKDYIEHDDRDDSRDPRKDRSTRRVSFKPTFPNSKPGLKPGTLDRVLRRIEEDDDMNDIATTSQLTNRITRRKGSPIPKGKFGKPKLEKNPFGWYQVMVKNGQLYSKDEVIRALLQAIEPDIFIPHYWRNERHCVIFFVDDYETAARLLPIERRVQMSDGTRLFTRVRPGGPMVPVDDAFKAKLEGAMGKRYNLQNHALDLSKFYADPEFKDTYVAISRPSVMSAILEIIEKNIPEIEALNLNENYLNTMESFKNVAKRFPNLKILYLGDNKLESLAHLLMFRTVPLIELVLKGNPLRNRYADNDLYVSEVRRKFPRVVKLDGVNLGPRVMAFDSESPIPSPKASFLCDVSGADIVRQFLEQYFLIFDSNDRQPLLNAYHEQAMMSMSVASMSEAGRLTSFWLNNRNLLRGLKNEEAIKYKQLKINRVSIVSKLVELPKTKHDPQSFSVDLTIFEPQLINLTVAGLFKEYNSRGDSSNGDVRHFQRQWLIVPSNGGFCIRNELIYITNATPKQQRGFMNGPPPAVKNIPTAATVTTTTMTNAPQNNFMTQTDALSSSLQNRLNLNQGTMMSTPNVQMPTTSSLQSTPSTSAAAMINTQPDDATKIQMVQAMSAQSTMNLEWSKKCLEETNWDYNQASFAFDKLHKENKIPAEAFIK